MCLASEKYLCLSLARFLLTRASVALVPSSPLRRVALRWLAVAVLGACLVALVAGIGAALGRGRAWAYGGSGGTPVVALCPGATRLSGMRVFRAAQVVAGVTLLCSGGGDDAALGPTLGSAQGLMRELRCPRGALAVGLWGAAGTYVDSLSLVCAPADHLTGPDVYLEAAGGAGGEGFHARCRKTALRGLQGAGGSLLDRVAMLCEVPRD